MDFNDVRSQYPQYNDMSDEQLATALHGKFYKDMDYDSFKVKVGLGAPVSATEEVMESTVNPIASGALGAVSEVMKTADQLGGAVFGEDSVMNRPIYQNGEWFPETKSTFADDVKSLADDIPVSDNMFAQGVKDTSQFLTGMATMPGGVVGKSALSSFAAMPEDSGLITGLGDVDTGSPLANRAINAAEDITMGKLFDVINPLVHKAKGGLTEKQVAGLQNTPVEVDNALFGAQSMNKYGGTMGIKAALEGSVEGERLIKDLGLDTAPERFVGKLKEWGVDDDTLELFGLREPNVAAKRAVAAEKELINLDNNVDVVGFSDDFKDYARNTIDKVRSGDQLAMSRIKREAANKNLDHTERQFIDRILQAGNLASKAKTANTSPLLSLLKSLPTVGVGGGALLGGPTGALMGLLASGARTGVSKGLTAGNKKRLENATKVIYGMDVPTETKIAAVEVFKTILQAHNAGE